MKLIESVGKNKIIIEFEKEDKNEYVNMMWYAIKYTWNLIQSLTKEI